MLLEYVAIPLKKSRFALIALGCFTFVALSIWLWHVANFSHEHEFGYRRHTSPIYVYSISALGISFFLPLGLYACIKLFDRSPGLIIDHQGIVDNSSGSAAGRVPWSEITSLKIIAPYRNTYLVVHIKHPAKFISSRSFLRKQIARANQTMYGSPVVIVPALLGVAPDDLASQISDFRLKYV